jgi:arylsulfatase
MHWTPQRQRHGFHQTILDESGREESPDFRSDYRSWFWSGSPLADPDATGLDWNGYEAKTLRVAGAAAPHGLDWRHGGELFARL